MAKPQTEQEFLAEKQKEEQMRDGEVNPVYASDTDVDTDEKTSIDAVREMVPDIGNYLRVTPSAPVITRDSTPAATSATPSVNAPADTSVTASVDTPAATTTTKKGDFFNNLDFLRPSWLVESITVGITKQGCVGSVEIVYTNGLTLKRGLVSFIPKRKAVCCTLLAYKYYRKRWIWCIRLLITFTNQSV